MIVSYLSGLGPWNWIALGCVLLGLEILLPGVFLLWIGIAAIIVGGLSLLFWESAFWVWQAQVLVFLALSLATAIIGRRIVASRGDQSDQPLLNRRAEQLVGRTGTLTEPLTNGHGRMQLGDTMWRISGPDLPAGTRVRVTSVGTSDLELIVVPV